MIQSLLLDPSSWLHMAYAGWQFPLDRTGQYLLDLIDTTLLLRLGDKHKPVPRPWDKPRPEVKKRTRTEALRILRPHLFND